ncbi:CxC2 domain-containing protein [Mycena venus]|uniref:CxC2 domain-containing protein n=1 Tax=Mycena venus TaxID=2733690 RepID=A0A8H7DGP3_9AGAR|nr:CxC2 domain-containing protein [Mycena venus]
MRQKGRIFATSPRATPTPLPFLNENPIHLPSLFPKVEAGNPAPLDWEKVDPFYRFIYWLFLSQDANFRLSNCNVLTEITDPILGDGFGYFCKREGEDGYKAHIQKHMDKKKISNWSGFAAMFMTNTKRVKGLQTTGIGGVTCSRHNMWQGNGIGDLQVGERYCNMNFLLLSVLFRLQLLCIVISYDIACQYNTTFWECMKRAPKRLFMKLKQSMVSWKVPNFHLHAHKLNCHGPFSFHFMWGTGMMHKQNWAFSNGAVASTRLMGPGAQQATLEDVFGFHNYDHVLGCEGMKHKIAFKAFTKGMEEARPEDVVEWKLVDEVSTLHDIQLRTAAEEYVCTEDVVEIKRDHTPRSFIMMGLELKQIQRKLEIDVRALKDPSPAQKLVFTQHRTSLLKRIHKFCQIQGVYMLALRLLLSDNQKQVFDGNSEQQPEATPLVMPSELARNELRAMTCMTELAAIEAWMKEGGAGGGTPWPLYQNDDQLVQVAELDWTGYDDKRSRHPVPY